MIRKRALLALALAAALFLGGCASNGLPVADDDAPTLTLPPAEVSFVAPIGDAALEYTANATLYLPRHDGTRLAAVSTQVAFSSARPHAESLVRALLSFAGDGVASSLGGSVRLSLYGVNPVEVSRDTVTVNLAASALQLGRDALYLAFQSITNTLTELPGINYVNFLVVDKPIGLDIANTLPVGAMSRSMEQDLSSVYEQLLSRRVGAQESAVDKPLSANATLYFPISGTEGLVSEVRSVSFSNQVLSSMIVKLLGELALGPQQSEIHSPTLPLLADLLTTSPTLISSESTGGQIITLDFAYQLDDMLDTYGLTRLQSLSAICYTMCTFFPNVSGIRVSIDGVPVGTLSTAAGDALDFESATLRRADFAGMLYDYCALHFADPDTERLRAVTRPVPYAQRANPRALLVELARGPQPYDSVSGLDAALPMGALTDADILGVALNGDTLLINLAPAFDAAGEGINPVRERLMVYAMVNTLCRTDERVKSVCFFRSGSQFDGFSGEIYWRGLFYPIPI